LKILISKTEIVEQNDNLENCNFCKIKKELLVKGRKCDKNGPKLLKI